MGVRKSAVKRRKIFLSFSIVCVCVVAISASPASSSPRLAGPSRANAVPLRSRSSRRVGSDDFETIRLTSSGSKEDSPEDEGDEAEETDQDDQDHVEADTGDTNQKPKSRPRWGFFRKEEPEEYDPPEDIEVEVEEDKKPSWGWVRRKEDIFEKVTQDKKETDSSSKDDKADEEEDTAVKVVESDEKESRTTPRIMRGKKSNSKLEQENDDDFAASITAPKWRSMRTPQKEEKKMEKETKDILAEDEESKEGEKNLESTPEEEDEEEAPKNENFFARAQRKRAEREQQRREAKRKRELRALERRNQRRQRGMPVDPEAAAALEAANNTTETEDSAKNETSTTSSSDEDGEAEAVLDNEEEEEDDDVVNDYSDDEIELDSGDDESDDESDDEEEVTNSTTYTRQSASPNYSGSRGSSIFFVPSSPRTNNFPPRHNVPPRMPFSPNPFGPPTTIPTSAIIAEVISAVLPTIIKLAILTWLAKQINLFEESMQPVQHFTWELLNDKYIRDDTALANVRAVPPEGASKLLWARRVSLKRQKLQKAAPDPSRTVIVVDATPDKSLDTEHLADFVNFLVQKHQDGTLNNETEIILLIDSPGGAVTTYGLAGSHVARLRKAGMNVTACIDRIAASGGYMMASQATKIIAAPFAMVGSIGVVMELLNFNEILNKYGVKPVQLTAGEKKRPISMYGKITSNGLADEKEDLRKIHESFIEWCKSQRPQLDLTICDGSITYGDDAVSAGLIDGIETSDGYIMEQIRLGKHVLALHKCNSRNNRRFLSALDLLPHFRKAAKFIQKRLPAIAQAATVLGMGSAVVSSRFKNNGLY